MDVNSSQQQDSRQGFGWRKALALIALLLLLIWIALKLPDFSARAELGAAYAAHAGCACHFIESRSMDSCKGDLEQAAWMVSMEVDGANRSVTASVPLLAERTARYRKGGGCLLDRVD